MIRIPLAVDRHGAQRLASSSAKCNEPFHCLECGVACVLKKGEERRHHFAHKAATGDANVAGCKGGGEGALHAACKLFIQENIAALVFAKSCVDCGVKLTRWRGTSAVCEKDIVAGDHHYRVDVLARQDCDSTEAVIEVVHTHRCSGDKLAHLATSFGDNVFEVGIFDLEAMPQNPDVDDNITLPCVNCPRCAACTARFEELQAKLAEQRRIAEAKRKAQAEWQKREDLRIAESRALERQRLATAAARAKLPLPKVCRKRVAPVSKKTRAEINRELLEEAAKQPSQQKLRLTQQGIHIA